MATIIKFPKQCQDANVNDYGLELFVQSCGKLLNTLPDETRLAASRESSNRLVEDLVKLMDACQEARGGG